MSRSNQKFAPFARRLRTARELRNLSQAELAERARLQQTAVSHYENGTRRPSLRNLRRLSEALEVTSDYLIGHANEPAPLPSLGEPLFRDFSLLTTADRELAREIVGQLARRSKRTHA
jgi:transcriptional regulator with XRE-family HTH domain